MKKLLSIMLLFPCIIGCAGCRLTTDVNADHIIDLPPSYNEPTGDPNADKGVLTQPNLNMETLKDIVSRKKENLTWSDFDSYYSVDIGSGLFILKYTINKDYYLLVGGVPPHTPMYIKLVDANNRDNYIDVRTENIDDFINSNK